MGGSSVFLFAIRRRLVHGRHDEMKLQMNLETTMRDLEPGFRIPGLGFSPVLACELHRKSFNLDPSKVSMVVSSLEVG